MPEVKKGELYKGYYFKGGNPKEKSNWVKPPEVGEVRKGFSYAGGPPWEKTSWSAQSEMAPKEAGMVGEDTGRGFLSGLTETMTLGYAPQLYGATEVGIGRAKELFGGEPLPENAYEQAVQRYKGYTEETGQKAPLSQKVGEFAGYLAPGSVAAKGAGRLIKGAGMAGKLGRAAVQGGAIAGIQDTEGDIGDRTQNAIYGALTGAAFTGGGEAVKGLGKKALEFSKAMRIKGAGAMLKDFRNIMSRSQVDELDNFLRTNKIVRPGSTIKNVAEKTTKIQKNAGKKLQSLYNQAKEKLDDPEFISKLSSKQQDKYLEAGFFPASNRKEILNKISNEMGDEVGAPAAVRQVDKYLTQLAQRYGDDLDIVKAREIKSAIDRTINYARNPLSKDPIKEQAFKKLRSYVNDRIKKQVDFLDEVLGGEGGKALKRYNKEYANASTVLNMATDKIARESGNRLYGLSEQIASGAGGVGGALMGDPVTAALAAGGGFLGSRALKTYGPGVGAGLLRVGSKPLVGAGTVLRGAATPAAGLLTRD